MAPLYGWDCEASACDFAPHGHWRALTVLGALRSDRLTAP